ncbi:MAG: polysaccharide biosynthesis protein, partial [Oscillospiraceae bacterium]|nr:polysaccharide biosynthesis protein [Oscillospiraceae bacterium]
MKPQSFLKGSLLLGLSALTAKLLGALFKIPLTSLLGGTGMGYFSCAYGLFLPLYAVFVTGLS